MTLRFLVTSVLAIGLFYSAASQANVVGSDVQNFNPTTSGLDFVTVQSSETLEPGIFNFGFFLNYAVNVMPNYEEVSTQSRTDFQDTLLGGDLNFGVGLGRNWDVGFSAPQVYAQDSDNDNDNNVYRGEISQTGLTEYRLNTKYRFFGDAAGGLAGIFTVNLDQTENNPFTGNDPDPTYNFELAWDKTVNKYVYGFNLGYRKRNPGSQIQATPAIPIEPFGDQFIASAAVSYMLNSVDTKLIGEIYGGFPAEDPNNTSDRDVSSVELLLGAKKDLRHDLALHFGGGTELYHGSSSPDWRVYTGVNWNIGPLWSDKGTGDSQRLDSETVEYLSSRPLTPSEKFVAGDVLFAFNSDQLSPQFEAVLLKLAEYLKRPPGLKSLVVEGHTDSVGPEAYNLDLSQRRASAVARVLVEKGGLPAKAVEANGYGETRPVADNDNYQSRAKNRRVEFNIIR